MLGRGGNIVELFALQNLKAFFHKRVGPRNWFHNSSNNMGREKIFAKAKKVLSGNKNLAKGKTTKSITKRINRDVVTEIGDSDTNFEIKILQKGNLSLIAVVYIIVIA